MKHRRIFALLMCLALFIQACPSSYAVEGQPETLTPPPELIILEGEEWIPGAVDPRLISTYGSDDDCRHNGATPSNYRYIGAVRGNTTADTVAVNVFTGVISVFVPGAFGITFDIVSAVSDIFSGDKLEGDYIKYQYIYDFGPDSNMYWFHTFFSFATQGGKPVGSQCYATYSPKKSTDDPFQD